MSKFLTEPTASMCVGNLCATCNTHSHPRGFVNLLVDRPGIGRVYVCAGCADEIGRSVGGHDPAQVAEAHVQLEEWADKVRALGAELEQAKENMVVPLAEVIDFLEERARRRPQETPPAEKAKA